MTSLQWKVFFAGTHRVRRPEDTWATIEPLLPHFDVTRVADVTGLDIVGIPVMMAIRPLSRSLSVSQGKGQTTLLAKISAAMEAIELWHAENVDRPIVFSRTPARELDLPYDVAQLASVSGPLVGDAALLDWVDAVGMLGGRTVPVPWSLVGYPRDERPWAPPGLVWSSTGLASGNSRDEAALHALYEIIERDAMARQARATQLPEYLDLTSITDDVCAPLIEKVLAAGVTLTITRVPSRFGVLCFSATVWSPDFPVRSGGWGAHLDPHVALSRAITEAVQSRLTGIAGSRDDLPPIYQRVRLSTTGTTRPEGQVVSWNDLTAAGPDPFGDVTSELAWACERVRQVTGVEPLLVDLSTTGEFAVVRVLAPGTVVDMVLMHGG
jgi:ribosomal protein S12 methylthiotransferase accessory factor